MPHTTTPSTTTIQIGAQEELGVLLERLRQTPEQQITLNLPDRAVVGQSLVTLKLLQDEAALLGKQVTLRSEQRQTQALAQRAGFTVLSSTLPTPLEPTHGFARGADVALAESGSATTAAAASSHSRPAGLAATRTFPFKWVAIGLTAAILLLSGVGFWLAMYYLPQAEVVLYTQERTLDRDLEVTADPTATTANVKDLVVPATQLTSEATKSQSFPATGKQDIGQKAKGSVTVYNNTDTDQSLAAGTVLTGAKQTFLLDTAVKIPAQTLSGTTPFDLLNPTKPHGPQYTPGSATVIVTAKDFGEDYNVPANTQFTVGKFDTSSMAGTNASAFTGGSKQTVTIVSADDRSQALDTLTSTLKDQTLTDLKSKTSGGQSLIDETIKQKITQTTFSNQVGDQASSFTLALKMAATATAITEDDIKQMLAQAIKETKVPQGYSLDQSHQTVTNHVTRIDADGVVQLTSTYKAEVIPQVDTAAMKQAIKGKQPQAVADYLKSQPNLSGYDIRITPKLPGPFYRLPSIDSHIKISVEVKK